MLSENASKPPSKGGSVGGVGKRAAAARQGVIRRVGAGRPVPNFPVQMFSPPTSLRRHVCGEELPEIRCFSFGGGGAQVCRQRGQTPPEGKRCHCCCPPQVVRFGQVQRCHVLANQFWQLITCASVRSSLLAVALEQPVVF